MGDMSEKKNRKITIVKKLEPKILMISCILEDNIPIATPV